MPEHSLAIFIGTYVHTALEDPQETRSLEELTAEAVQEFYDQVAETLAEGDRHT